jgi:uncharacterized membrane protein
MKRIAAIDITRGIVMVIMALDHVRDLMHVDSITQSPTNLQTTSVLLFFTRWITHFCAPTFVFLAGTSAWLSIKNNDFSSTRAFLIKRGIYLILLELVIVNLLLFFDPGYHTIIFEVIAAIGFGFIMVGLFAGLSPWTIATIGLIILFGHNLISNILLPNNSTLKNVISFFLNPGAIPLSASRVFVIAYPPLPWLAIMLLGFATGKLFEQSGEKRNLLFVKIGLASLVLFIIIRFFNFYGDPLPWSQQKTAVFTLLSFLNVTKYPPSLLFGLVTLSGMFFMLAFTEKPKNRILKIFSVYGKVPLFYFLLHFLVIHTTMVILMLLQGFSWEQMDFASGNFGRPKNVESGVPLWEIYLIWIAIVILLYKPCLWFGKYKSTHTQWWLKYI